MTRWRRIKDIATAVFGAFLMFIMAAGIVVSIVEEFGWLVLLVPLGIAWAVLKPILLLVVPIFVIFAIWVLCKIAESSDENETIVSWSVFFVATVLMALWEFGVL